MFQTNVFSEKGYIYIYVGIALNQRVSKAESDLFLVCLLTFDFLHYARRF